MAPERSLRSHNRDALFALNKNRLEQLAFIATQRGHQPEGFVAICANVDDPTWAYGVSKVLMPGFEQEWESLRNKGITPLAMVIFTTEILDTFRQIVPAISPVLDRTLPTGMVRALVLSDGGISVYEIRPTSHRMN